MHRTIALALLLAEALIAAACSSPIDADSGTVDAVREDGNPVLDSHVDARTDATDAGSPIDASDAPTSPDASDAAAPLDATDASTRRDADDVSTPHDAADASVSTDAGGDGAEPSDAAVTLDWHPGNYVLLGAGASTSTRETYLTGAVAAPFEGVQIEYTWPASETSMGVYDFAAMDGDVMAAAAAGKHVILMLQYKTFGSDPATLPPVVPSYMRATGPWCVTPTHGSTTPICGQYDMGNGVTAMIWNAGVADRIHAWYAAVGAHYSASGSAAVLGPTIAGIVLPETACSDGTPPLADVGYTAHDYVMAIEGNLGALADAFPTKPVFQYINFLPGTVAPDSQASELRSIATWALSHPNVGIGCPDLGDPSMFGPPGYSTLFDTAFQGRLPVNVAVESMDYDTRTSGLADTYTSATAAGMRGAAAQFVVWAAINGTGHLFTIDDVSTYITTHLDPNTAPPTY